MNKQNSNNDLYSIKSSALNSIMLEQKRKDESYAYIIGTFSQFLWSINSIQLKSYQPWFPTSFSNNSLVFWRSLPIWLLGWYFCYKKNITIIKVQDIKHKYWFFFRSFGNYISIWLWISVLSYFRVSTCQVISGCNPILVIIISIIYLKETFYFRYIICLLLCIAGSSIIILNERNPETKESKVNDNIFMGLLFALANLFVNGLSGVGQKVMVKEKLAPEVQNYYLGFYNTIPAFIFCIFEWHIGMNDPLYVLYGLSNGALIFYVANYFQTKALEFIAVSKFVPLTYLQTVFVFILSVTLLGESIFLTDLLGASLIIGFQIYNYFYPPHSKRKKHIENEELNNKIVCNNNTQKFLEPIEEHIVEHENKSNNNKSESS